jgi:hypothetical protein
MVSAEAFAFREDGECGNRIYPFSHNLPTDRRWSFHACFESSSVREVYNVHNPPQYIVPCSPPTAYRLFGFYEQ